MRRARAVTVSAIRQCLPLESPVRLTSQRQRFFQQHLLKTVSINRLFWIDCEIVLPHHRARTMSSQASAASPLVRFYDPNLYAPDSRGRTLPSILAWTDDQLEFCHDYIQVLFPLPEGSPFNPSAPIIDRSTFNAFRSRPELRAKQRQSLERMLKFYGFAFEADHTAQDGEVVVPAIHFRRAARNWVMRFNHNHLRITRILRSLRVLGLEEAAEQFYQALRRLYSSSSSGISQKSMMFWERAAERPLFLAPEHDEDVGQGRDFLHEFEEIRSKTNTDASGGDNEKDMESEGVKSR